MSDDKLMERECRDSLQRRLREYAEKGEAARWFTMTAERASMEGEIGWQPIETAPRDDTQFLALCADGRMMIWSGRIFARQNDRTPEHLQFPATHWQPLPEPPALTSSKTGDESKC